MVLDAVVEMETYTHWIRFEHQKWRTKLTYEIVATYRNEHYKPACLSFRKDDYADFVNKLSAFRIFMQIK